MGPLAIIMAGARLLKAGSRAAALTALKQKHGLSDTIAKRVISKAAELTKQSEKTGKPISELVKKGTGSQTVTKNVAKTGVKAGAVAGGAAVAGLDALVNAISETTSDNANAKSAGASSTTGPKKRKTPEETTIVENRRVVSETKLAKGGMAKGKKIYANCGASVPGTHKKK